MDTVLKILYILMLKTPGAKVESCVWNYELERIEIEVSNPNRKQYNKDRVYTHHIIKLETNPFYSNTHERHSREYGIDEYLGII